MNMNIRPNKLRYCLENNLPTLGTRVESPWAYITEIAASSGFFDYIEFEGEYAPTLSRMWKIFAGPLSFTAAPQSSR